MRKHSYGIPYTGSKNRIAKRLIDQLPPNEWFVDLFGGGGAMTQAALESGKYEKVLYNELNPLVAKAVRMYFHGEFADEKRWISREEFFKLKDTDPYVAICYSFGNNLKDYAYSQELEPYKRAFHYAIVFDDWKEVEQLCPEVCEACKEAVKGETDLRERRLAMKRVVVEYSKARRNETGNPIYNETAKPERPLAQSAVYLERLQDNPLYEQCDSLAVGLIETRGWAEQLGGSLDRDLTNSYDTPPSIDDRLVISNASYDEVAIPANATIYCDPPYRVTQVGYGSFDFDKFNAFIKSLGCDVYISERDKPFDGCEEIYKTGIASIFKGTAHNSVTERLYKYSPRESV